MSLFLSHGNINSLECVTQGCQMALKNSEWFKRYKKIMTQKCSTRKNSSRMRTDTVAMACTRGGVPSPTYPPSPDTLPPRKDKGPEIPYTPLWTDRRLWKHNLPLRSVKIHKRRLDLWKIMQPAPVPCTYTTHSAPFTHCTLHHVSCLIVILKNDWLLPPQSILNSI